MPALPRDLREGHTQTRQGKQIASYKKQLLLSNNVLANKHSMNLTYHLGKAGTYLHT